MLCFTVSCSISAGYLENFRMKDDGVWPDLERWKQKIEGVSVCWLLYYILCEIADEVIL